MKMSKIALVLALACASAHAQTAPPGVTPPAPEAVTQATRWWQWYAADMTVAEQHGIVDCSRNQPPGTTWFLAGTNGNPARRSCRIPRGMTLFFPAVTTAQFNDPGAPMTVPQKRRLLEETLSEFPADGGDSPSGFRACNIAVNLDGLPVTSAGAPITRAQTLPFFAFGDPQAVGDGHWAAVSPTSGLHNLRIRGSVCDRTTGESVFDVDVTYLLDVQ